jgi:hypothetical protein
MGSAQSLAQSFVPDCTYNLTKVSLYIEAVGTPGALSLKLMGSIGTSPNTRPDDNVLTQTPTISSGNRSYFWATFIFNKPYAVKSGTEYFIVAEGTGSSTSNCWVWYTQATGQFSEGDYAFKQSGGWLAGARDCYFRVFGRPENARPNIILNGNSGDKFGWSVSSAGDLNNDNMADLAVGAPFNDSELGNILDAGAIYVFYGGTTLKNSTAQNSDNVSYGESIADNFGWSIFFIGDINGDNFNDILIGAPYYDNNSSVDAGKIYVMSCDVLKIVPEFEFIFLPILILFLIIAIVRGKRKRINKLEGVSN